MMNGIDIIKARDSLKAGRTALEGHWDELSNLFMPFRLMTGGGIPDIPSAEKMFDSSPRRAALTLANGLASLVTPREEMWFEFQPPRELRKDDDAVRFYRQASETAREFIESSNFYEEIQEAYIESPVFGTAALFCGDLDDRGELFFRHQPIKTYYISEDAKGRVNALYRDLHLTAEQAAEEFGEENLPPEIISKLAQPGAVSDLFDFVHAVKRRIDRANDEDPENLRKPWQSVVVHEKSKMVVQESGYDEFPFAVHRFRRFGRCVWGFGPGTLAAGDARQLQFLNELADVATEKSVFPPLIAPSSLEGEIGQGALEITYVDSTDPNSAAMLREWATAGRYDVAKDRMADKRTQVEQSFYVDLFQLFANRAMQRGPMTATEASLVAGEKLTQFSPIFGRLVSEMLDPVLSRVFGVLLRNNQFGPPPPSVMRMMGGNRMAIASPSMLYKNRIMLAMQARENGSLMEFMGMVQPMIQLYPEAVDALDMPTIVRESARNGGLPETWIRSKKAIEEIQVARAQQRAQEAQMQQAEQAANVAQKVGSIPADARQQMGDAINQAR
jgi:hypothetical protein